MTWLALAEALERADGPSRELDVEIARLAGVLGHASRLPNSAFLDCPLPPCSFAFYTASLDAIVALIGEKLPGWAWAAISEKLCGCIGYVHNNEMAFVGMATRKNPARQRFECRASTPALALCAAFAKAMSAAETTV